MRRSAAPSQTQRAFKRQKTDTEKDDVDNEGCSINSTLESIQSNLNGNFIDGEQPCNKENTCIKQAKFVKQLVMPNSFKTPVRSNLSKVSTPETTSSDNLAQYYNVMWGKMSKKKHKKWEGDGILVTKGRTAILQDTDGKEIGKGQGYKAEELSTFSEGQTLCVGGKLIEIIDKISKDVYLSAKCFQQMSRDQLDPNNEQKKPVFLAKPFSNPQKTTPTTVPVSCNSNKESEGHRTVVPRHDPCAPGALVMPRPSASHQWDHNKRQATIVDVVVDPYVANALRPHQREGVRFLYECVMGMRSFIGNGAILADDMGLGKTLQCIALVWTLYKQGMYGGQPSVRRILIVTPGSLVKNWAVEFRKWLGNERMAVYTVNSEKKVQYFTLAITPDDFPRQWKRSGGERVKKMDIGHKNEEFIHSPVYPVMVISYEMFVRYVEDIKKIKFNLIVCDEAHRLKNAAIKTTMHLMSLKIRRKILLTGTPIQNDLTEFFCLAEFCNPGIFGSQASFKRLYEEPIGHGHQPDASQDEKELGESRANELNRQTSQFLLRRTSDINNKYLPSKVESVVFCHPSDLQITLYEHLISSRWFRSCVSSSYAGSLHLMCIAALKKLCNHPSLLNRRSKAEEDSEETLYDDIHMYYPAEYDSNLSEHSGKLKVLEKLLINIKTRVPAERCVVVSNYTQTLDIIQSLCERSHYQFLRLDGQTATNQRQNLVERFNRKGSEDFVFLLSSKAGGVGLNLTGGSILILFDIDWNPANDIQAMARVWRDGQKKEVKIYRLLTTGTIEEKIYQRQVAKQGLSGTVADGSISSKVEFSRKDLKDLFTLHTKTTCLTHELLNCSCIGAMGTDHSDNNPTRACQLGNTRESKGKNLSMAELMQWSHFARPIRETNLEDEMLRVCADDIDFVFQTQTN